jgi:hypothetical protein
VLNAVIGLRAGRGWADTLARKEAAGVEIHLGRFFLGVSGLAYTAGSTVSLCPRICLCVKVQLRVLNSLKAALARPDDLTRHPISCIQIRVSDPVGMKQVELAVLWHLASGSVILGYSNGGLEANTVIYNAANPRCLSFSQLAITSGQTSTLLGQLVPLRAPRTGSS